MPRNSRVLFSSLIAAIGGGLLLYGALQWQALPQYSEPQLAAAVELNLSFDLQRLNPDQAPSDAQIDSLRKTVRSEVEAKLAADRDAVRNWCVSGLVLLLMALSQILTQRYLARSAPTRPAH